MIFKNEHALIALSVLVGIATDLGLIGAQSYLLSYTDAVYTIYGSVVAYLLFSLLLRNMHRFRLRFAQVAAAATLVLATLLLTLSTDVLTACPKAMAWYVAALFGFGLLRWITSELTSRYLDPARAQSYFSYLSAYFEGGALVVILSLRLAGHVLSPNETLLTTAGCCLLALLVICIQFVPAANFEALPSAPTPGGNNHQPAALQALTKFFIVMTAAFAVAEIGENYLANVVVRHTLENYTAIRAMTDTYFAISCALIVIFSISIGKIMEKRRLSPLKLLTTYGSIMAGFAVVCWTINSFYLFIAFEVARRTCEYCLYRPANQMITSSLAGDIRPRLVALHSFTYYVVVRSAIAITFTGLSAASYETKTNLAIGIIICAAIASLVLVARFKQAFDRALYELIKSVSDIQAVLAANMLSYVRPYDYLDRMRQCLGDDPKRLLRKTIVLGLGYSADADSIDTIRQEFRSDKEEVQIAALHALRASCKFRATSYMVDVLCDRAKARTQRVRLSAMYLVGGIFGKKAIPFLLNGLTDPDPRVVANTLEVLSYFKHPELTKYFQKFVNSDVPRVRANALLGLSRVHGMHDHCRDIIKESLKSNDVSQTASLLYAIGRLKDKHFHEELTRLYENPESRTNPALGPVLAWALLETGDPRGLEITNGMIALPEDAREHGSFMHFFSLHAQKVRYDIIRHFVAEKRSDRELVERFCQRLENSAYDFQQEIEYLKLCIRSLREPAGRV